jgi:hypothetical protein
MSSINVELVSRYLTKDRGTPAIEFNVGITVEHEYLGELAMSTRWSALQISGKFSLIRPTAKFDIVPDGKMVAVVQMEIEKALKKTKYESLPVKVWGQKIQLKEKKFAGGNAQEVQNVE